VSDESTPEPQPTPEEPSSEGASEDAVEREGRLPRPFLAHFARVPILGTDLTIRAPSIGQDSATYKDMANEELDDREFTVCLVQRQLDQDASIEDVRSWTDAQLLAAADAFLSLDTGESDEQDDAQEPLEGEVIEAEPDVDADLEPLTFASFRAAIRQQSVRRAKRFKSLIAGIEALSNSAISPIMTVATKGLESLDAYKLAFPPMAGMDLSKIASGFGSSALEGIDLKALQGTSAMGDSIKKMLMDTQAVQKFNMPYLPPLEMRTSSPAVYEPFHFTPVVRPEIGLLQSVGESLEKLRDDQARLAEDQVAIQTQQGQLMKVQGEALKALVSDARDQKWPRRAMLGVAVVTMVAAIAAAFLAGGIIRPFGAGPAASPAPIVTSAPVAPSPSP
jgi:hypothetical protein